jgi:hypothetical protein
VPLREKSEGPSGVLSWAHASVRATGCACIHALAKEARVCLSVRARTAVRSNMIALRWSGRSGSLGCACTLP